jgi:signal transduction histidine kinase
LKREKKTILIIDDEESMRFACRSVLEDAGYSVVEAPDGEAGLSAALEIQPDLILCDIEMPRKNGFEVLEMFRARPSTNSIPFIFLTGRSEKSTLRKGMDLGADDFLTKPFMGDQLVATVKSRLQRAEAQHAEAGQKLDELRYNISSAVPHELRTPLTGILGFGAVLKEQAGSLGPKDLSDIADHIIGSGRRLQQTLEKFWLYSEIAMMARDEKTRDKLSNETIPGAQNVIGILARKKAQENNRPNDLQLSLVPDFSLRMMDKHLPMLLEEILGNAFKFSKAGTPVEVSVALNPSGVEIRIKDHGKGMSSEEIDRVGGFMQFGRQKQEQQGLGLGLAIARELVALYGGELHIESEVGQHTTVRIQLKVS